MLSQVELDEIAKSLHLMNEEEQIEVLTILEELERRNFAKSCQDDFIEFCKHMHPQYHVGAHHKRLGGLLMDMERGDKDRIAVSIAPRHGKSEQISTMFPAWYLGKNPDKMVMLVSHTADLAVDFGRKVRNLIQSDKYAEIFPTVRLSVDSKSAGRWNTNAGGGFYATGVGSALAGRGADFCLSLGTKVHTLRGVLPAKEVQVGDFVYTHNGYVGVKEKVWSFHRDITEVDSLITNTNHPLWVWGKGFIHASEVRPGDVLWTIGLWDIIVSSIRRYYEKQSKLFQNIQHMGANAPEVQQPQRSKLSVVRRARDFCVRAMGQVQELLGGYGAPSLREAHVGPGGQRRGLHPRELPLDNRVNPSEQSTQQRENRSLREESNFSPMGERNRAYSGHDQTQGVCDGDESRGSFESSKDESQQTNDKTVEFGRIREAVARRISRCHQSRARGGHRAQEETIIPRLKEGALRALGIFVGVRAVTKTRTYEAPAELEAFVNFEVGGDNTFFADSCLTHNCIIDDPHNEQDIVQGNYESFDKTYEWFTIGARTRLMKGGKIAVVHTRWHPNDLIGRLTQDMVRDPMTDQYELFEFPAILNEGTENEKALWPEFFDLTALRRTKASMPLFQWNAQYQQNPTGREGAIVPRDKWRKWTNPEPPSCSYIIMSVDAAAETRNRSDFSVISTWGVFTHDTLTKGEPHIILLNCINERMQFPELKRRAYVEYEAYKPDSFIVEKKSNGVALYQEMRRAGIPVQEFTPTRATGDKVVRLNAVADMFESGMVWYPAGMRWAEELVEQVAAFPASANDDMVDATSMALARFRQGGFIQLPSDFIQEETIRLPSSRRYY